MKKRPAGHDLRVKMHAQNKPRLLRKYFSALFAEQVCNETQWLASRYAVAWRYLGHKQPRMRCALPHGLTVIASRVIGQAHFCLESGSYLVEQAAVNRLE